jgi:hypothetical protein
MDYKKIFRMSLLTVLILGAFLGAGRINDAKAAPIPTATLISDTKLYLVYNGAQWATFDVYDCLGNKLPVSGAGAPGIISVTLTDPDGIKSYLVKFYDVMGGTLIVTYDVPDTGVCGSGSAKPVSKASCNKFFIENPIVRGDLATFTFKGNFKVDELYLYFPKINLTLYPSLISYEWATRTWTGTFNSIYLPQGKHHGRLYVSYEGIPGKSCPTGGIKVVAP